MLINEVSKRTKLTKKAIEYDTLQGLVTPTVLENGYRDYSEQDIELLQKVCVLRKLDVGTDEIRLILADETNMALQVVSVRKELDVQRATRKKGILQKLSSGKPYCEISAELNAVDESKTITEKLLDAFPGYYGRFLCLHFARFLNEPIQTKSQQSAFDTILSFLDTVPPFELPKDLEDYLIEGTKAIGTKEITEIIESAKKSVENPDDFLLNNQEMLEWYLAYKKSAAYRTSPAGRVMELMSEIHRTSGYYDVFIPAMKKLSSSYSEYYRQLEIANEKLLEQYPEIEKLNTQRS